MNKYVWFNHFLPQTLQIAVALAYFRAVFTVLFSFGRLSPIELGLTALMVAGAFGMANLKYWGYWLSLISAILPFIFLLIASNFSMSTLLSFILGAGMIFIVIQIALLALLVHPMSRDFVKSNFTK